MGPSLSLIIPTLGRSTLPRAVDSALMQARIGDEIIVVMDGPMEIDQQRFVKYIGLPQHVGDYGCTPCDVGIGAATGDYIFFLGDDDICDPVAFDLIRSVVGADPNKPYIFSMMHTGRKLGGTIGCCSVSGQQIVVPRDMNRMPKMADFPPHLLGVSDWVFVDHVWRAWDCQIGFHDGIIAHLPTMNQGRIV